MGEVIKVGASGSELLDFSDQLSAGRDFMMEGMDGYVLVLWHRYLAHDPSILCPCTFSKAVTAGRKEMIPICAKCQAAAATLVATGFPSSGDASLPVFYPTRSR